MAVKRYIYTLEDLKQIIAYKHKISIEDVVIYNYSDLTIDHGFGPNKVDNETYILHVDEEE
jgi:hypothetical protein